MGLPIITKRGVARIGGLLVCFLVVLFLVWAVMLRMPGESFRGDLPEPNERETELVEELHRVVTKLAEDIGERNTMAPGELERAAEYLERELLDAGYSTERQTFEADGEQVWNIVAELPGGRRKKEIIVVGAHYDSVVGCPGANDNATGVAAVLALARALADRSVDRTIRFVLFVNEEPPFFQTDRMGSVVYARSCQERGDNIVAMLSLETMGYFSDVPGSQDYPPLLGLPFPTTGNFIAFVGNMGSGSLVRKAIATFRTVNRFPSEGAAIPGFMGAGWSDNWSFAEAGYDAIMVTDTAPYRYPDYHRVTDVPDRVDFPRLARVVAGLEAVVTELSRGD